MNTLLRGFGQVTENLSKAALNDKDGVISFKGKFKDRVASKLVSWLFLWLWDPFLGFPLHIFKIAFTSFSCRFHE